MCQTPGEELDQRKPPKLQPLQDLSPVSGQNTEHVWHKTGRHFENIQREYLNDRIIEFDKNSKNKSIRLHRDTNEEKVNYMQSWSCLSCCIFLHFWSRLKFLVESKSWRHFAARQLVSHWYSAAHSLVWEHHSPKPWWHAQGSSGAHNVKTVPHWCTPVIQ